MEQQIMWWERLGYFPFEPGKDEYPRTGQIIKYYREQKKDQSGKSMSQEALAKELKLKRRHIINMEKGDYPIDIERRRILSKTLNIPPVLFGIMTLPQIAQLIQETNGSINYDMHYKWLADANALHQHSTAKSLLYEGPLRLNSLYSRMPSVSSLEQSRLYQLLYDYHLFMISVLRAQQRFDEALVQVDKAMVMGHLLNNNELRGIAAISRATTLMYAERKEEALRFAEEAGLYKNALPGQLYHAYILRIEPLCAQMATTMRDKRAALALVEQSGSIVRSQPAPIYRYCLDASPQGSYLALGETLVNIGWNKEAIRALDQVQCDPDTWWYAYRCLYQARASLATPGGEDFAAIYAQESMISVCDRSDMHIIQIKHIYDELVTRNYRGPEMTKLARLVKG